MATKKKSVVKISKKSVSKAEVIKALEKAKKDIREAAFLAGNYAVEVVVRNAPKVKKQAKKLVKNVKTSIKENTPIIKEKAKKIVVDTKKAIKSKLKNR